MNATLKQELLQTYYPPKSAKALKNIPSHRITLGNFPTPLQSWQFSWEDCSYNMLIKRDDLSELTASGNKLRKLEFILPQAILEGNDWIISLGPIQSNCCRVVSAVAPRIGLRSAHVLIYNKECKSDDHTHMHAEGNLFFHKLFGSELFLASKQDYITKGQDKLLEEAKLAVIKEHGPTSNPYILPMGGNTVQGVFGYMECFFELEEQLKAMGTEVHEIFFSVGSGGTAAGLAIGKYLTSTSSKLLKNVQLTGYIVWDSTPEHFHAHVNEMLEEVGLGREVKSEQLVRFVVGKGSGYGLNTEEEIDLIDTVAKCSGIVLDGTYTVKAVLGFLKEGRAKQGEGKRCLFLHTGGLFSMMGKDINDGLKLKSFQSEGKL